MIHTLVGAFLRIAIASAGDGPLLATTTGDGTVEITIAGAPFTTFRWGDTPRPTLDPLIGPSGRRMTRAWPRRDIDPAEAHDHPHHQGLWLAHGSVGGRDFWHGDGNRIAIDDVVAGGTAREAIVVATGRWMAGPDAILDERRTMAFTVSRGTRIIDVTSALTARGQDVVFGDTKEGTFAARLAPALRLRGEVARGSARSSAGAEGASAWGTRAAWMAYWGPIEGEVVGIAILDHPRNPRHPTWWHARDYGLLAANPFGAHDFEGAPPGTGDLLLTRGETLVLRYRVVLFPGEADAAALDALHRAWSRASGLDEVVFDAPLEPEVFVFSDPGAWTGGDEAHPEALVLATAGAYEPPHRSPRALAILAELEVGDFALDVDAASTARAYGHRDLCIVFGFRDPTDYFYVHLAPEPDEHAHNVFRVKGAPRAALLPVADRGIAWSDVRHDDRHDGSDDGWHHVRVVRAGDSLSVWFDDMVTPVLVLEEGAAGRGRVGLGSFDDTGRFARLRIRSRAGDASAVHRPSFGD